MFGFVWRGDKSIFLFKGVIIIIAVLNIVIDKLNFKWIVDGIQAKNLWYLLILVAAVQLIRAFLYSLTHVFKDIKLKQKEYKIRNYLQNIFIKMALKQDLARYENQKYYDHIDKALKDAESKALDFVNMVSNCIQQVFVIFAFLGLIVSLDIVLLSFTIVLLLVNVYDSVRSGALWSKYSDMEESINRRSDYIKRAAYHKQFAMETRMFNLGDFLLIKLNKTFGEKYNNFNYWHIKFWRHQRTIAIIKILPVNILMHGYLVWQVLNNRISIGDFAVLFGICYDIVDAFFNLYDNFIRLHFQSKYRVSHLRAVLDYHPTIEADIEGKDDIESVESIEFRNVCFSYPDHEERVLKNVSFIIGRGQKLAIVGKNGAGKSTMVKLLLRLYDVTDGEILINNKNIKSYNIEKLRKCFSATLQNFNVYAFTIAENITLNDENQDMDAVNEALAFSGLRNKVNELKEAANSYWGREFDENGVEFSGGETQKLAIARAYAHKNSVFILDEANSALDPIAEYELNQKLVSALSNQIVVFITHRLSTTIHADMILVVDNGQIAGAGTHERLLGENALYADMFNKQARAYISGKEAEIYE
jgi:ATP-binding cassette subfamily B protein